jgi:hypothetical protein
MDVMPSGGLLLYTLCRPLTHHIARLAASDCHGRHCAAIPLRHGPAKGYKWLNPTIQSQTAVHMV